MNNWPKLRCCPEQKPKPLSANQGQAPASAADFIPQPVFSAQWHREFAKWYPVRFGMGKNHGLAGLSLLQITF
jgi:hypothetical protein